MAYSRADYLRIFGHVGTGMKKIIPIAAVLIVVCAILVVSFVIATEEKEGVQSGEFYYQYAVEEASLFEEFNIVVLSYAEGNGEIEESPANVRVQETFDSIENGDIVIVDANWAKSIETEQLYDNIDALVIKSHLVMVVNADSAWIFTDREIPVVSLGFSMDRGDVYCLFYDSKTKASFSNSITDRSMQESLHYAFEWIE